MMLYYQGYSTVTDWPSTFGRFACKEIIFPSFYKRLKNHLWDVLKINKLIVRYF